MGLVDDLTVFLNGSTTLLDTNEGNVGYAKYLRVSGSSMTIYAIYTSSTGKSWRKSISRCNTDGSITLHRFKFLADKNFKMDRAVRVGDWGNFGVYEYNPSCFVDKENKYSPATIQAVMNNYCLYLNTLTLVDLLYSSIESGDLTWIGEDSARVVCPSVNCKFRKNKLSKIAVAHVLQKIKDGTKMAGVEDDLAQYFASNRDKLTQDLKNASSKASAKAFVNKDFAQTIQNFVYVRYFLGLNPGAEISSSKLNWDYDFEYVGYTENFNKYRVE